MWQGSRFDLTLDHSKFVTCYGHLQSTRGYIEAILYLQQLHD